jgi:2-amino-4-hydroxy-6-hydroxymethyldihydropteridine diphosphokinase
MLDAALKVARLSSVYETEHVGVGGEGDAQPTFLNMVAEIEHVEMFSPEQMLARLLRIEYALGRRRDVPHGPRTIDLDLLLYGEERRATPFLTLPHPRLHERRFVLVPLAELAPSLLHPSLHKTANQLLAQAHDASEVRRWQP